MYCQNFRKHNEEGEGLIYVVKYIKKKLRYKVPFLFMLICCSCIAVGCSDATNGKEKGTQMKEENIVEN